jgi:hypothetical protein
MPPKDFYSPYAVHAAETLPFRCAEEAWFWFIAAQNARCDGARVIAGASLFPRPCEPLDILKVVDRLYRGRRLLRDHLLVLRHYGRRYMPPDQRRRKEQRAHVLWTEALQKMESVLEAKGIVQKPLQPHKNWKESAVVHQNSSIDHKENRP